MKNPEPEEAGRRQGWANELIARLDAADHLEQTLFTAVHDHPDLAAETDHRRANALHAAAMGLGPAGCAAAAGITESLLASWRKDDPAFDTAVTAATAMAGARHVARQGQINAFGLRLLLQSIAQGVRLGTAAAAVGLRRDQLTRMRRSNPAIDSLLDAAILKGRTRHPVAHTSRRPRRTYAYRLVTRTEPGTDGTSPEAL
ncbi:hypothetical protein [Streptomyces sp. WM6372]|uniref:hypothetical protein n=1 Tax=Streptomyces sp. WM6372 TaxID=1415555 RepID=UPI0006AFE4FF|nr:hypothetical protein [Streptomyces sp. WM6372]